MTPDLLTNLITLLERWDAMAAEAAQQVNETIQPVQRGFYAGVVFGMETAHDDLAAMLAWTLAEATHT